MIGWLIEMQGPSYLTARYGGGYNFMWTDDPNEAIRFIDKNQADLVMMSVRQLRPELFPNCLTRPIQPTEHAWIPGEGWRKEQP